MQEVTWEQITEAAKLPDMQGWGAATEERIRHGDALKVTELPDGGSRTFEAAEEFRRWYESLRLAGAG